MRPQHQPSRRPLSAVLLLAVLIAAGEQSRAGEPARLEYNKDVRPILAENCFACHGPDSAARKADLRLDQRAAAVEREAFVPGNPAESELILRITSEDPAEVMPPPKTQKALKPEQIAVLKRWIQEGAEYQPHWSFIPPVRPELPEVKQLDWCRNPIDRFILAKLEAAGLQPAPEADRRTLARRLSLDLTGLPPDPALVERFVNDPAPDAYERLVDRLIDSQEWGEHRGRYWLDYARYADTHGIHFDNYREMWSYRDWVINAFNRNQPFDRFTLEQLAGDLLPNPTLDQLVASGFNRCNITTNEGGVIAEEYLVLYTRDRTETTSLVWMGLTAGCAVCHDHKFDPLSQREFYELAAFFNNTTQGAMDGNIKDTPPVVPVPLAEDRDRLAVAERELAANRQRRDARKQEARVEFNAWLSTAKAEEIQASLPTAGRTLHAPLNEGQGRTTRVEVDGKAADLPLAENAVWQPGPAGGHALQTQGAALELPEFGDLEKDQPHSISAWIKLPANDSAGAIAARMDDGNNYRGWDFWVQRRQVGMHLIHRWQDDALKVVAQNQVPGNQWTHVAVTYDGSAKAAGVKVYYNGASQPTNVEADGLKNTTKTGVPFKLGQRHNSSPLSALQIQDLRVYNRALSESEVAALANGSQFVAVLQKPADQRTDAELNELYSWWLYTRDESYRGLAAEVVRLEQEVAAIKARGTVAHVMNEKNEEAMAFVLFRGEYDKRRDPVKAGTPSSLPAYPADLPRNRLGFAQWLLRPEHPLTARVTVNRFWQEVFGTGIVKTSGDFGVMGELPTHPELLDWLAVDFRENGWDVKRLFRQMVTSSTYRQAALATPEKREKDPENRLLSRGPRFRMDAEMIRDYALASSGLLVRRVGGPSVKPYQPDGVWEAVAMNVSNTREYRRDSGENLYRRSMYWFWKRAAPPASMEIFNAPNREVCSVRRERTNTPLQALVTLNDPQFVEAARMLAELAMKQSDDADLRIDYIARRLLARPFKPAEMAVVRQSLADLRDHYLAHEDEARQLLEYGERKSDPTMAPGELAAWTMLVNELMNLDEVLTK